MLKGNNKILEKIQTKKRLSKKESKTVLECFVKSYSADIWTAAVGMYSIMRVIEIFYSFVKEPVRIDNLIVTHKYICDVWKNGSKHLYFYTLHNQEHAIVLIQNIVKLINTIDFLKISSIDYYIILLIYIN